MWLVTCTCIYYEICKLLKVICLTVWFEVERSYEITSYDWPSLQSLSLLCIHVSIHQVIPVKFLCKQSLSTAEVIAIVIVWWLSSGKFNKHRVRVCWFFYITRITLATASIYYTIYFSVTFLEIFLF